MSAGMRSPLQGSLESDAAAITARRFKRYPEYKDSDVDWLRKIPAHWRAARISELTTLINGYPFDSEFFVRGEGIPLVRIRDLNAVETDVSYVGPPVESAWIESGDVIIGMDGDFNVARWRGQRALLNQRMCCLRPRSRNNSGFIAYLLPLPLKLINDLTYSTTVKHLSSDAVRKVRLGVPPESEQRAIVAFLDRETARIDDLIAKKERLVELLHEKRTTLIAHVVTNGLNANVPTKDSGVEWLGRIPAHWDVVRLKDIVPAITVGIVVTPSKYYVNDGVPCLRSLNIASSHVTMADMVFISPSANELHRKSKIFEGDVLVVRTGKAGTAVVVPAELDGANCIDLLIIRRSELADSRFLYYFVNSPATAGQVEAHSVGAIQAHYNTATLANLRIPRIPVSEQLTITAFLDRETARFDGLIKKIRVAIDGLEELRTSLISAAVTGKIDVREEVA
jgi:type I restriction enzyme S subunit